MGHVPGRQLRQHVSALVEVAGVEGVGVVVVDGLDVVVPPPGHHDAAALEQRQELLAGHDAVEGVLRAPARRVGAAEVAPVVDDPLEVGLHVPPEPPEAGEL